MLYDTIKRYCVIAFDSNSRKELILPFRILHASLSHYSPRSQSLLRLEVYCGPEPNCAHRIFLYPAVLVRPLLS